MDAFPEKVVIAARGTFFRTGIPIIFYKDHRQQGSRGVSVGQEHCVIPDFAVLALSRPAQSVS